MGVVDYGGRRAPFGRELLSVSPMIRSVEACSPARQLTMSGGVRLLLIERTDRRGRTGP